MKIDGKQWALGLGAVAIGAWLLRTLRRGSRLDGKVALVTGGSRGLGLAIARELAQQGARLVLCARDAEPLARARAELESAGADVFCSTCDVRDAEAVARLVDQAVDRFGGIDILVNNAGVMLVGPFAESERDDFQKAMDINFWGSYNAIRAVLPHFRRRGAGHIVQIGSIGGKVSAPHLLPYNCSKFAVLGLAEGLRGELRRENIRVTVVAPGLMRTGSPVHVTYWGRAEKELLWFAGGAVAPFITIDAARAARRIVRALRREEPIVYLTVASRTLALANELLPRTMLRVLDLVNRLMPRPGPGPHASGRDLLSATPASMRDRLLDIGARYNQR